MPKNTIYIYVIIFIIIIFLNHLKFRLIANGFSKHKSTYFPTCRYISYLNLFSRTMTLITFIYNMGTLNNFQINVFLRNFNSQCYLLLFVNQK